MASPSAIWISSDSRAAFTFRRAASSASGSLSKPSSGTATLRSLRRASARRSSSSSLARAPRCGQRSTAKSRPMPGARRRAMRPPSMSRVPEPHIGSTSASSPV